MNGNEAIEWIHQQLKFGIRPGLDRVHLLLARLGHPEKELKLIHVGGTNGKGSTVTYLRNLLQRHGFKIGTFTSPYIEKFEERISINGYPIDQNQLASYVEQVKPICEQIGETELGSPTEFEIITVIALMHFQKETIDFGIMEVGLGGRLDSTNVITPILSLITSIGMDHMNILGDTIEKISYEKAGIIKQGIPIVTNVDQPEALDVIASKAKLHNAPFYQLGSDYHYEVNDYSGWGESFDFLSEDKCLRDLELRMKGQHQIENATLSMFALMLISKSEKFKLFDEEIKKGLLQSQWPGRLEIIHNQPKIILDGAHNFEAVKQLVTAINSQWASERVSVLLSVIKNKPIDEMVNYLKQNFPKITLTPFDFSTSYEYNELYQNFQKSHTHVQKDWKTVIDQFIENDSNGNILIVTGSLYFVSQVRAYVLQHK
ncbi:MULTISPECIES: folylpolyglutamate synthase/dihydrofolate synthase family protein [Allobacillus]|uniref:bifunctional folylpolyglutamate synthase/dihydrofolate synthase n=1 Tax=Allobacillus TaxID=1400133 RepID=UPI0016427490|nr:folylpolyglutamate synthase/dihydrofolate synthase family protein [Allobacillus salarius]